MQSAVSAPQQCARAGALALTGVCRQRPAAVRFARAAERQQPMGDQATRRAGRALGGAGALAGGGAPASSRGACCAAAATSLPCDELTAPFPWDSAFCSHFLATYWQRRPLLVRQALPGFRSLLSADELAGLACELPSRIIMEQGGSEPWELVRTFVPPP